MKAVRIHQYGSVNQLQLEDLSLPRVRANEILVKQEYAGLNFIDIYFRRGIYKVAELPRILGVEGGGIIEEVGKEVTRFKVGERVVYPATLSGSYAEYTKISPFQAVKIPDTISTKTAVSFILQGLTSHYLTNSSFHLKEGHRVLVHAAAGGVGLCLLQICKMKKAKILGLVSNEEKRDLALKFKADEVLLYGKDYDFLKKVRPFTQKKGFDVVYDSVGAPTFDQSLSSLKQRGSLILFGQAGGIVPPFDISRLNYAGSIFLSRPSLFHFISNYEEYLQRAKDLFGWIEKEQLKIHIDQEYSLDQLKQAHLNLESRKTLGKSLIKIV